MKRTWLYLLLFVGIFALDFTTKFLTQKYLGTVVSPMYSYPYGGVGVFDGFLGVSLSLTYVGNTGAAWGAFSDYSTILLIVRLVIVAGLVIYVVRGRGSTLKNVALTCIISGALGNIFDMVAYKHVIDMVKFVLWGYHYPVFNVADMAICTGIGLLILDTFNEKRVRGSSSS